MKKFMGTPGPWTVKGDEVGYISDYDDQSFGMFCPIAIVTNEDDSNLISAAPDMFEALQGLVNDLVNSDEEGLVEHAEPIVAARAAIAKALGNTS